MGTCERGFAIRRGRAFAALLLAVLGAALATGSPPAGADTVDVTIAAMAFSPETVTVEAEAGEPDFPAFHAHVNFLMRDEGVEHSISFDDRALGLGSSGRLAAGQVYPVIVERAGIFTYHCEIHPAMTGTVIVRAATSTSDEGGGDSGTTIVIVMVVVTVLAAAGAAFLLIRRRRRTGPPQPAGPRRR